MKTAKKKLPKNKSELNVSMAILFDPCASQALTVEEEIESAVSWFEAQMFNQCGLAFDINWYQINNAEMPSIKPGTDVILFDFGGMYGCDDLRDDLSRSLIKFAADNPSVLVMVTSKCTWEWSVKYELADTGLDKLANVVCQSDLNYEIPEWFVSMKAGINAN